MENKGRPLSSFVFSRSKSWPCATPIGVECPLLLVCLLPLGGISSTTFVLLVVLLTKERVKEAARTVRFSTEALLFLQSKCFPKSGTLSKNLFLLLTQNAPTHAQTRLERTEVTTYPHKSSMIREGRGHKEWSGACKALFLRVGLTWMVMVRVYDGVSVSLFSCVHSEECISISREHGNLKKECVRRGFFSFFLDGVEYVCVYLT
jgi:hypothetical protein